MWIRWQDRVSNQEVLERANTTFLEAMIQKAKLRRNGNIIRMDESRIPRQFFYGEQIRGRQTQGRLKNIYKDNLKSNEQALNRRNWRLTATENTSGWRASVKSATINIENHRRLCIAAARDRRKRTWTPQLQSEAQHARSVTVYVPQNLEFRATCVPIVDTISF